MRIAKNYAVIKVQCERFNSTYARLNPALGFESRISKYISGAQQIILVYIHKNDVGIYNVIKVPELLYSSLAVVEMLTFLMFKPFFTRIFTTGLYL